MKLATHQKIAMARFLRPFVTLPRRVMGKGESATVKRLGLTWRLELTEGIDFAIYLMGAFERQTVATYRAIVKPGDTVLDIGANIGAHTLPLADAVGPKGHVFAFEPTARMFTKLTENLALNPECRERVSTWQMMLLENAETKPADSVVASWPVAGGGGRTNDHGAAMESTAGASATSLDAFLKTHGVERVDFIKLDVDGYEPSVLAGAGWALSQFRPVIILEMAPYELERAGRSIDDVLAPLREARYQLFRQSDHSPLPLSGTDLVSEIPPGGGINVIARPSEGF